MYFLRGMQLHRTTTAGIYSETRRPAGNDQCDSLIAKKQQTDDDKPVGHERITHHSERESERAGSEPSCTMICSSSSISPPPKMFQFCVV